MSPAQRDHMLATALRQVGRVNRLCVTLLDVERVDVHGELRLDLVQVSVRRAVDEAVDQLSAREVVVDVPDDVVIEADADRFEQILVNLIGNAMRYGLPPIEVTVEPEQDWISVCVRDHGPGVPPEALDRLFARFTTTGPASRSSGLGLWIVDQLARAHGGRVRYEPAEPGARMVVTLPVTARPASGGRTAVGGGRAAARAATGAPYP
jgi:signal transduction histidine kinase